MRRQWLIGLSIAAACGVLLLVATRCGSSAEGVTSLRLESSGEQSGAGLVESHVMMARPEIFPSLERPPVVFDHGKHTQALKDEGCQSCHQPDEKGDVSYEYVAWQGVAGSEALRDAYHEKCNTCHYEGATEGGKKVSSLGCGECHVETTQIPLEWYPPTFDHFPHLDAMEKGCDTCHHQYDEQQQKLVYVKGQEKTCGNCHQDTPLENRGSLRAVGHTRCIGCHEQEYLAGKVKLDPYDCRGCHRPEAEPRKATPLQLVARNYQARPGQLLISYPGALLPPVPFDHEKHDPQKNCSKSCHNFHVRTLVAMDMRFKETASSCEECHRKSDVSIRPGALQAEKIYHDQKSANSCVGCHMQENKRAGAAEKPPVTCKGCHKGESGASLKPVARESFDSETGPETYVIGRVSNKYLPVKFPHLQHTKMVVDCASCHHHEPENQRLSCNTCHGEPMDFMKLTKPRLISAYHRMCMGCHRDMGSGPVACAQCHEERELIYPGTERLQSVKLIQEGAEE